MIKEIIINNAKKYWIDDKLALAIATVESSLNPSVMRFEPNFRWLYHVDDFAYKLKITNLTEETLQKFSYGLFQTMGSLCREYGFDDYLPKLLDPDLNANYGCRHIKSLMVKFKTESDVISAFNQGSPKKNKGGTYLNQSYVDKVFHVLYDLRKLK